MVNRELWNFLNALKFLPTFLYYMIIYADFGAQAPGKNCPGKNCPGNKRPGKKRPGKKCPEKKCPENINR
jgi:hypothetical protein